MVTSQDLRELTAILPVLVEPISDEIQQCSCCGVQSTLGRMTTLISIVDEQTFLCWICADCLPEAKATNGATVLRSIPMNDAEIEEMLRIGCRTFDSAMLKHFDFAPFVRRPNFVERERAKTSGEVIPDDIAVVVTRHDSKRLRRKTLPTCFPWRPDEWYAGPVAAREALAFAKEIERGEAEAIGFCMTITPEAFKRVQRAGRK